VSAPTLVGPPPVDDGTRRELLAAGLALSLGLAACGEDQDDESAAPRTRTIRHALGAARVPVEPQRVASISVIATDPLLTLGVPAVAVPDFVPEVLESRARRVRTRLGLGEELDLEALAATRPDLILADAFEGEIPGGLGLERLERIAPTVVYGFTRDYAWRDYYRFFADALGRGSAARGRLAELDRRIARVAEAVGDPGAITASVIEYTPGSGLRFFRTDRAFAAEVLDRIGFARPDVAPSLDRGEDNEVSLENLTRLDADVVFVFGGEEDADAEAFAREPLADRLRGRVFPVDGHWFGFGLLAAEAVVEDVRRLVT